MDALVTVYDGVLVKGMIEYLEESALEDIIIGVTVCAECKAPFIEGTDEYLEESALEDTRFANGNDDEVCE